MVTSSGRLSSETTDRLKETEVGSTPLWAEPKEEEVAGAGGGGGGGGLGPLWEGSRGRPCSWYP